MPGAGSPDFSPSDTNGEAIRKLWGLPPIGVAPKDATRLHHGPFPPPPERNVPHTDGSRECQPASDEEKVLEALGVLLGTPFAATGKASNPKDAAAFDKAPLHLVPASFKAYTAIALAEGAMKYGSWNWRAAGVRASVYVSALHRHLDKWFNGEELDPETGVPHLANACACLAVLIDSKTQLNMTDDRPPRQHALPGLVNKEVPAAVAKLRDTFGHLTPKHFTINDDASEEHF